MAISDLQALTNLHDKWWDLCDTDRQVIRLLQTFYRKAENPRVQPRRSWFMKKTGLGVGAISRSLSKLREESWLSSVFRGRKGNLYTVPEWLRKLNLNKHETFFDLYVEDAEKLSQGAPKSDKKTLFQAVKEWAKESVKESVKESISGEHNSLTPEINRLDKTGNLRACGNVHDAARSKQSNRLDSAFLKEVNLEEKSSIEVATIWRNFNFQDGTMVKDHDMRCWLKKHGAIATHCALLACQFEVSRQKRCKTNSKAPGVRFVQSILDKGTWKRIMRQAKNHDTAMNHLVGKNKALYRVNYSSAYIERDYDLDLATTPANRFEEIIERKTGIASRPRKGAFDKYMPKIAC